MTQEEKDRREKIAEFAQTLYDTLQMQVIFGDELYRQRVAEDVRDCSRWSCCSNELQEVFYETAEKILNDYYVLLKCDYSVCNQGQPDEVYEKID
jgi:RNase H-fold protein (predicted Holliday junction resolvase)